MIREGLARCGEMNTHRIGRGWLALVTPMTGHGYSNDSMQSQGRTGRQAAPEEGRG